MKLPINTIIQGDSLEMLKTFPSDSIDLIITDPPYGTGYGKVIGDETLHTFLSIFSLAFKVLRDTTWLVTYCFPLYIPQVIAEAEKCGFKYRWIGMNYYPNMFKQKPWPLGYNRTDLFLLFSKGNPKKSGYIKDVIHILMDKNKPDHPHAKPAKCADKLLKATHIKDGVFLDPFCGTGVFCQYAKMYSMNYIGIDIDKDYCDIAIQKIKMIDGDSMLPVGPEG